MKKFSRPILALLWLSSCSTLDPNFKRPQWPNFLLQNALEDPPDGQNDKELKGYASDIKEFLFFGNPNLGDLANCRIESGEEVFKGFLQRRETPAIACPGLWRDLISVNSEVWRDIAEGQFDLARHLFKDVVCDVLTSLKEAQVNPDAKKPYDALLVALLGAYYANIHYQAVTTEIDGLAQRDESPINQGRRSAHRKPSRKTPDNPFRGLTNGGYSRIEIHYG